MRIVVDGRRCQGDGACVQAAPDVFALSPGGPARVLADAPGADRRRAVEKAARRCPTQAIRVTA